MTAKLNTGCSVVVPPVVRNVILKLPAATAVTNRSYKSVPDFWFKIITSVAATVLFVTVNDAAVADPAALNKVIAPDVLLRVTPVVRLVNCVTAPPAPVAYPTPAVPVEAITPVAVRLVPVAAPITGVTNVGVFANTAAPVPVSSVRAAAKFALDGVAKNVATSVAKPDTPVAIGKPVQLVNVPEVGMPRIGVTNTMLVDVQAEMLPLATVPNAGVTNAGLVLNTKRPVPVSSVIAARRLALVGFAKKV